MSHRNVGDPPDSESGVAPHQSHAGDEEEQAKVTARYDKYRQMYTNCTVIDGNLEIVFLIAPGSKTFDLDFLRDIREVTSRPALLSYR